MKTSQEHRNFVFVKDRNYSMTQTLYPVDNKLVGG
jgi:hypothetical protein